MNDDFETKMNLAETNQDEYKKFRKDEALIR